MAKALARQLRDGTSSQRAADAEREHADNEAIVRLAVAAGWSLQNWVQRAPRLRRLPRAPRLRVGSAECGAHAVVARVGGGVVCSK